MNRRRLAAAALTSALALVACGRYGPPVRPKPDPAVASQSAESIPGPEEPEADDARRKRGNEASP